MKTKQHIGWSLCPLCKGEGKTTTKAYDYELERCMTRTRTNSLLQQHYENCNPIEIDWPKEEYESYSMCKGTGRLALFHHTNNRKQLLKPFFQR